MIIWLDEAMNLRQGMRVLDLGRRRVLSSIFLHRELDVQVCAAEFFDVVVSLDSDGHAQMIYRPSVAPTEQ